MTPSLPPWRRSVPYRRDLREGVEGPPEWRCWGCCARSLRRITAGHLADGMVPDAAHDWAVLHLLFGREPTASEVLDAERWIRDYDER